MFDTNDFLNQATTEAMSTKVPTLPIGQYQAFISETPEIKQWSSNDGSKSGLKVAVKWEVAVSPEVAAQIGREKAIVPQDIMLDIIVVEGKPVLDTVQGKNVNLGRLREATGLNEPGVPFRFADLAGKMAVIEVKHRMSADGQDSYAEVKKVSAISY